MNKANTAEVPTLSREAQSKFIAIDLMSAERYGAQSLLEALNKQFPLSKEMPADFKGAHSLTLRPDGKLQLNVWAEGHVWPVTCNGGLEAPPRMTLPPNFPQMYP